MIDGDGRAPLERTLAFAAEPCHRRDTLTRCDVLGAPCRTFFCEGHVSANGIARRYRSVRRFQDCLKEHWMEGYLDTTDSTGL